MRNNGTSIIVIARELGISKSTISSWCRDIILTEEQFEKLRKSKGVSLTTGQRMGAETNKRKRLDAIKKANDWGEQQVEKISDRELLLIAAGLYWCEGSKSDTTSTFMFVNSDPDMILIMKKFLVEVMKVNPDDIVCGIQINRIHEQRIEQVLIFWKKLLKLQSSQIRKPYFVNTKVNKVYENYDRYYGVCRLFVRKGKNLKYKILGLIQAVKVSIMPA